MDRNPQPASEPAELGAGGYALDAGAVMSRIRSPLPLSPANAQDFARPMPDLLGRVGLYHGITSYSRPWDKSEADFFTGNHGIIERQPGFPVGKQEPQGGPAAVVYRPIPVPWDCGTALQPTTLNTSGVK